MRVRAINKAGTCSLAAHYAQDTVTPEVNSRESPGAKTKRVQTHKL